MTKISFSDTRKFTDHCKHIRPGDIYHGSVCVDGAWHDVYSYESGAGRVCCFRYGKKPSEYIGPGGVEQAIQRHLDAEKSETYGRGITPEQLAHHMSVYRECLKLIKPEAMEV